MAPPDTRPRSSARGFLHRSTLSGRGARAHLPRLLAACVPLIPAGLPAAGESLRYSFGYTSGSVQSRGGGVVFNEAIPAYSAYPFRGNGGTYSADIPPRRRFAEGAGSLYLSTGSLSTKLHPEFMAYRSLVGNGGLTMELWIKGGGGSGCIMTVSGAFGFEATATGIRWVNGFYVPDGVAADLSREDWHHLAGVIENPTRSGTDMVGDLALYVDGVFRGRRKGTTWPRDGQIALTLGDHPVDYIKEPWTGQIYEPRITLGVLTPERFMCQPPDAPEPLPERPAGPAATAPPGNDSAEPARERRWPWPGSPPSWPASAPPPPCGPSARGGSPCTNCAWP